MTRPAIRRAMWSLATWMLAGMPAMAQTVPAPVEAHRAFVQAWLSNDRATAERLARPQARVLSDAGGDVQDVRRALSQMARNRRGQAAKELLVHREVVQDGHACVIAEVLRADIGSDSQGLRRSAVWLQSNDGWKLAQMHISPYRSFESSIQEFEAQDRMQPPRPRGVVFVGSSSIRMWKSLPADFPGVNCIPRGFGGSQLVDSVIYAHRVITPYKPRKVVVYAGDNDISAGKDAQRVLQDFRLLVESVHERVPDAEIGFVAIKPSISRWRLWPEMNRANQLVAEFAASRPCVTYLDVATPMLGPDGGQPAAELFLADGLHMTPQGYAIWTKVIRPWVEAPRTAGCGAAG